MTSAKRFVRMPKSTAERSCERPNWADHRALGSERARICSASANGAQTRDMFVVTHLILETEEPRPSAEDERIVRGDNSDHVDALRLELVVLLEERRQVVRVAGRLIMMWLSASCCEGTMARVAQFGAVIWIGRTVNAPGTETKTTFLPFHSSVLSLVASEMTDRVTQSPYPALHIERHPRDSRGKQENKSQIEHDQHNQDVTTYGCHTQSGPRAQHSMGCR